jgi:hypothetical protein
VSAGPEPGLRVEPADRRMTATYVAVIVVEVVTLATLWWLQTTFGAR